MSLSSPQLSWCLKLYAKRQRRLTEKRTLKAWFISLFCLLLSNYGQVPNFSKPQSDLSKGEKNPHLPGAWTVSLHSWAHTLFLGHYSSPEETACVWLESLSSD